ncbi:7,8-didemethyl-8-hydroxy-5-deazariboflavin synthase subunit CofH [Natronocalculus amylovorans]|uniref:7,8-didemethyl-8-hydroxy-5-deazariboflavin synthase subunit CofH n=1 Tax=Natronocalculus amylovorans TaxID=2917812 RepID=A0AAE3K9Y0_9EURY|nr:7,8-didemethyl-8-hydroxy-5-deazariboflavin synthase subunit CofH [Natronocalculus amylovorans]MCL9816479.1 7,8-didemethyl-8-hydroxy-5-deazariboflavin synthase subunit CofH [Natronocalculus amylovorans]
MSRRSAAELDPDAFDFECVPTTDQSFENALANARNGDRLTIDDGIELMATGTETDGIDHHRKELVLEAADQRRAEVVGDDVTFVVNLNNNVTTACNVGCLFCNFKNTAHQFEASYEGEHGGFTKTPEESRAIVTDALDLGISEVCSVSGLHPAFALNQEHHEILSGYENPASEVNYKPPETYTTDPGTYIEQIEAMSVEDIHVHSMTPEEAYHAIRGTEWTYKEAYEQLRAAGLDSAPGTAAEILVDEVRDVICPGKITSQDWVDAIEGAIAAGLDVTSTIMYGHVENVAHRVTHLNVIRDLQDRTGGITEFVPLSFIHENTPLYKHGVVDGGASDAEDELMIAVSRLFLDNIENIQSSWVKYGNAKGLKLLNCGANDFMGTILSEEITKRAGGKYGEYRTVNEYGEMISAIGRPAVERSTDYRRTRRVDPDADKIGPQLGPRADGTPMFSSGHREHSHPAVADD